MHFFFAWVLSSQNKQQHFRLCLEHSFECQRIYHGMFSIHPSQLQHIFRLCHKLSRTVPIKTMGTCCGAEIEDCRNGFLICFPVSCQSAWRNMVADQKWACKDAAQTLPDTIPCTVASTRAILAISNPMNTIFFPSATSAGRKCRGRGFAKGCLNR